MNGLWTGYGRAITVRMARRRYDGEKLRAALTATRTILRDRFGEQSPGSPDSDGPDLLDAVIEGVLRIDDLARNEGEEPPHDRGALRVVVGEYAQRLVERAPGRSVELRVPPYLAVQVVEGPPHTRGNPPNVVETDPVTWLRLATGRSRWAEALASGRLAASGERADLSRYLPLD